MKRANKIKKAGKGMSSAVVLSILIHAGLFLLAGMLVVFTVVKKEEKQFEPPKAVERPKMKLRKPKVKPQKSSKPKSTTRIVTRANRVSMPDIQLPEMSGMGDGMGDGVGGGFDMMPDLGEVSIFGAGQTIGSDFEGELFDLKRDRQGGRITMDKEQFMLVLRKFCVSGWKDSVLSKYYRSPKKLFATHFIVPPIVSPMAPDAFGDPEMESYWFFVRYKGNLVHKEDITFRFWGTGDAYIVVFVDGKHVLINGWTHRLRYLDFWQTSAADSDKYFVGNQRMKVSDWITLKAGVPVEMQVLFGEWEGGQVSASLLVEVEGEEYPKSRQGGPLLPAFKTTELSLDMLDEIRTYLPEEEVDLTGGTVFNDYYSKASQPDIALEAQSVNETSLPEAVQAIPDEDSGPHIWTMADGSTRDAEFVSVIGGKVALKGMRGKTIKIPKEKFSNDDLKYIQLISPPQLDLEFSRKTKQRVFPFTHSNAVNIPRSAYYTFSAKVKQTSVMRYDQELVVEFFAIGDEVAGNKYILLDYQRANFVLTNENERSFEFAGKTIELLDYNLNGQHRGSKFGGHLVLVTDSRGEIIAYKTTKGAFYENLENLRKIPVGRYFDKTCTRCTPTRPKPWY